MSTSALNSAVSGLRLAQKALDVTSSNISNAETEGYTKKTLPQTTVLADGVGVGVRYGEVQRYVNEAVQRDYRTQLGVQNYYTTRESYLSRIIALSGSTDSENNIGAAIGTLYNDFVGLSSQPSNLAKQNDVVASAQSLAKMLNVFASQLSQIRNDTQKDLKAEVTSLNSALQNIAQINKSISGMKAIGRSTADLEDQRDILVKQVAGQVDVSYYINGDGVMVLQTADGHVMADLTARTISFSDTLLTPRTLYPDGGVSGIVLQDSSGSTYDMASGTVGGKIGSLLQIRDQDAPSYNAQLDELAYQLIVRFNNQGIRLFTDAAGGIPASNASSYAGIAGSIQVNASVVSNPGLVQQGTTTGVSYAPSDNTIINRVINTTFARNSPPFNVSAAGYNQKISFNIIGDLNASLQSFANAILDEQAGDYDAAQKSVTVEAQYMQQLQTTLLDSSAVNTDEEMAKMIQYQRTYSASAKMISALDELFRDLLNAI